MGEFSAIEWTDHTFNPFIGCTRVSPGCDHCYAETFVSKRMGKPQLWKGERHRTSIQNWNLPLRWNRKAEKEGRRYRVFCASLADVFDNQIEQQWRDDLWGLIHDTPNLDWLLLTKRPQNIAKMLPDGYSSPEWGEGYANVWLGATVENQEEAERRIPHLLAVPAHVRFLSCEPLLEHVQIDRIPIRDDSIVRGATAPATAFLDWIICGGESGPGARPMRPDWARSLRDQCKTAGVAYHFKQWGDYDSDGVRVGKKRAGRLLDGVAHDEFPAPPHH